jgi:hypothetical protein
MASRPKKGPPEETGRRLATCERGDLEELRIVWQEYQGHPFVNVRLWARGVDGGWYPDPRRGVALKRRELLACAHALDVAVRLARGEEVPTEPAEPPIG